MQDLMIMTSGEWVMLALATIALVHAAVISLNLHKSLVRAEQRSAFRGLMGALSDVPKRTGRDAAKTRG